MTENELLFFQTIPRKAIWGKRVIKEYFGYEEYPDGIGQTWAFADQPGDRSNLCVKGAFQGETIHYIWKNHPELFQSRFREFPFIISLVGPSDDLSLQVHPDKKAAAAQGFGMGKNEAWYFIKTDNSSIVYGHTAKDTEELRQKIKEKRWTGLFRTVPVHDGDFVYIPAGTVHAMGKNNVVYEIQQATDLTYRIYDYDRRDAEGNPRELHTQMALKCIREAKEGSGPFVKSRTAAKEGADVTEYITNDSFTVVSLQNHGRARIKNSGYKLCSVVEGNGTVNRQAIRRGDHFLLSSLCREIETEGTFQLLITCEESVMENL